MKNNELITGELKQMSLLMHYDRSKTLLEQDPGFDGQKLFTGARDRGNAARFVEQT